MHTFKAIIAAGLFAALTASAAMAQDQAASFNAQNANVHSGPSGQALTLPSQASAPSIVADFLRGEGLSGDTVGSLVLQSENSARTGLTHLRFEQQVDGLTVFGAYVKATVNGDGQLVHLIEALATPGNMRPAVIGPRDALDAAMAENHSGVDVTLGAASGSGNTVSFSGDDFFYRDPTATRVAIAMNDGALQEGFLVETWSGEDNLLNHTLVGANGRVLGVQLRTNNDSYKIFLDQPLSTPAQTTVDGPGNGAGNTESPSGWLLGTQTTLDISGNNVNAYLDRNNNDSSDGGGSSVEAPYNFLTNTVDPEVDPTNPDNQKVAVQNLFYFNNLIHDKLYSHGFDEAAGNFQENNFGNGGAGGDSVDAEAQDGGGTNNANFSTPSDGSNPRMQMYIFTKTTPNRDGDLDSDIIWHEYGHGLTWRMIGSMSGPMSGAIGEGMGDVLAILNNNDDKVGEYSWDDSVKGIRSAAYSGYSRTYGDFDGGSVHFDGEIYGAIGWRLGELFPASDAVLRNALFDYLIDGMNFTAPGPAFEDMRDGILAASPNSAHDCLIWEAFAQFGVGEGARGTVKGGGPFGGGKVTITESFVIPDGVCGSTQQQVAPVAKDDSYTVVTGQTLTVAKPGVLSNDTDDNGDVLTAILDSSPSIGIFALNADGSFTYDATGVSAGASVTFTYFANDDTENSIQAATVTIDVVALPTELPLYVSAITFDQKGPNLKATVVLSQPISASVTVCFVPTLTFCPTGGYTVVTSGNGKASWQIRYTSDVTYSMDVLGVAASGYYYDVENTSNEEHGKYP